MFPRSGTSLVCLLLFSGLLLACQGDQGVPSEPAGGLELAGGPCKNDAFSNAVPIYKDPKVQSQKLQACKQILGLTSIAQAELAVDQLLADVFDDYHASPSPLQALSGKTLPASVATYIGAACGLVPLSADECLTPSDFDDPLDGIQADELDGWLAEGPLTGTVTVILPNGLFAIQPENAQGGYAFIRQRPRGAVDGPCPGPSPNDCQSDVYDVDIDGPVTSATVESCNRFSVAQRHMRCPEGENCQFGQVAAALGVVSDAACTAAGLAQMGFWERFAYQSVLPFQWVFDAPPAHGGVATKFEGWSPIVAAELDPRTRGVDCRISSSQFNAGSEGTVCRVFNSATQQQLATCTTVAGGSNSSSCTLNPLVPGDITVFVTAEKTGGAGAYNATSAPFTLGPADPPRGDPNKQVCFSMTPPTATQVACP